MKIAIIGSGIAGLTAAYQLAPNHDVTVIERLDRPGMDAHRTAIDLDGQTVFADVPSRMFNQAGWPTLANLYRTLGVETESVDPTQSFSTRHEDGNIETFLKYSVAQHPMAALKQILSSPTISRIQVDASRLKKRGRTALRNGEAGNRDNFVSFSEYLRQGSFRREFIYQYLYPTLSSTICTCSFDALDNYPADVLLSCLTDLNSEHELMRTTHGTGDVVEHLLERVGTIRTGETVTQIKRNMGNVQVATNAGSEFFDHVIVATQANTAANLLSNATKQELAMLASIKYGNIEIAVHTDPSLMPERRKDRSTFNMINNAEHTAAMCTVWLNRFHSNWAIDSEVFQTIGPVREIDPACLLARLQLQRPVVTKRTAPALELLEQIQTDADCRVWFCGSWADYGVPLLETGVTSANRVAARIGELAVR